MAVGRFIARLVGGVATLAVAAFVFLPVMAVVAAIGIPLVILAVIGVVGAVAMFTVGLPVLIVGTIVAIALAALISVTFGLVSFGILLLKVAFVAILLSWLFRKVFGRRRGKPDPVLVGRPVADIAAPRDRYEEAAERELDRELGL